LRGALGGRTLARFGRPLPTLACPPARRPSAPGPAPVRSVDPPVPPAARRGLLAPQQARLAGLPWHPHGARAVRARGDFLPWAPQQPPASA
jgi:hypothetical protein